MKNIFKTLLFSALLLIFVFLGCNGYYWPMGDGHMYGYGMYGMGGGMFMWIIILILVVLGAYFLFQKKDISEGSTETPIEILKKRYARGEITKEEYEKMKSDLE